MDSQLRVTLLFVVLIGVCMADMIDIPAISCSNSFPNNGAQTQTGNSPFAFTLNATHYEPGDVLEVVLYSQDEWPFRAFQMRAQRMSGDTEVPVGEFFDFEPACKTQMWYPEYPNQKNCLTHSDDTKKTDIITYWRAPPRPVGDIMFRALVMVDEDTFWSAGTEIPLNGSQPSEDPPFAAEIGTDYTLIDVNSCGDTKGCLKYPTGCQDYDCQFLVLWSADEKRKRATFEMFGSAEGYIAIGLSEDDKMGDDNTYACVHNRKRMSIQHGYNQGHRNVRHRVTGLSDVEMVRDGERIYCRFTRPFTMWTADMQGDDIYNKTFDLRKKAYLFIAFGDVYNDTTVLFKHTVLPIRSHEPIDFLEHKVTGGRTLTDFHVSHISLGMVSRLILTGILILIPRYFRVPLKAPGRRDIPKWALAHRFLAIGCISINITGVVVLWVYIGWTKYATLHAYFGLTTLAVAALLIITGGMHSCLKGKHQNRLDIVHNTLGYILVSLALITVFLGLKVDLIIPWVRHRLQSLVIGWVIFHIMWFLIFEILKKTKGTSGDEDLPPGLERGVALKARGAGRDPDVVASEGSYTVEKILLLVYVVVLLLFLTICLIYLCLA